MNLEKKVGIDHCNIANKLIFYVLSKNQALQILYLANLTEGYQ